MCWNRGEFTGGRTKCASVSPATWQSLGCDARQGSTRGLRRHRPQDPDLFGGYVQSLELGIQAFYSDNSQLWV